MQPDLPHTAYFICVMAAAIVTTPHFVLVLSKSSYNNNNTKDWDFYLANSHNLTALNDTGTLKDCSTTGQMGPCWNSPYKTFVP
jgi:hypothetical protein